MGKKEKKLCALRDEFQAMIKLVPKLKELLCIHKEIAEGYQEFRKNGGDAICGIEKHFSFKVPEKACCCIAEETGSKKECKEPKVVKVPKKPKKLKIKGKLNSADPAQDAGAVT